MVNQNSRYVTGMRASSGQLFRLKILCSTVQKGGKMSTIIAEITLNAGDQKTAAKRALNL